MKRLLLTAFFLLFTQAGLAQTGDEDTSVVELNAACQHLISAVENSGLTFIRNGNRATADKAAQHIRRKYEHFQDEITTPEEFIELTATRSLMTGKAYEVILSDGQRLPLKDWMLDILQQYRDNSPSSP
jgi:uncharacterized protein YdcH (DUF465 family)